MNKIETKLVSVISDAVKKTFDLDSVEGLVMVEIPRDNANGDYSSNIAMRLAKLLKKKPFDIANELKENLTDDVIDHVEVAMPGFINFWMKKGAIADVINTVFDKGEDYGKSDFGKGEKYLIEYVSANPTGILHLGHARGAAWGDSVRCFLYFSV